MRAPLLIALLFSAGAATLLLLKTPYQALPPAATAVTPESLAREVEEIRGLHFIHPLKLERVSPEALEKSVRAVMSRTLPPAESQVRLRAALALGLIRPGMEFDAADCLAGSYLEVPAACYLESTATMLVSESFAPEQRPDLTSRLVFHLARALLHQHGKIPLPSGNDDSLLTALAIQHADAAITLQRHTQRYAGRISAAKVSEVYPYHASPPFLRAIIAFPASTAGNFHTTLRGNDAAGETNDFLNQLLTRPPQTTAELLHPELYPAPARPPVNFERTQLPPLPLLAENTLGEFGIRTLFKTQLTATEAESAATGWQGDRYLLFSGSGTGSDHLVWRSRWRTSENASAFLRALAATHLGNAGEPAQPKHFSGPASFRAGTATHTLLARMDSEHTVTFAASPDAAVAERLLALP
jgi:hypothetical protein